MASNQNPNGMFETVSGIQPDRKKLPFTITTTMVETWIKKRVSALQSKMDPNGDPIEVEVYSTEVTKYFVPLVVTLSTNALDEGGRNQNKSHADDFFTTGGNSSQKRKLKGYLYEYFKNYTYSKQDIEMFNSTKWRNDLGVSRQQAAIMRNMATPSIMTDKSNGKATCVYFVLDPIMVFRDMLRSTSDTRNFVVDIEGLQKQNGGEYSYQIVRRITNKNKGNGNGKKFFNELSYRMRNGRN